MNNETDDTKLSEEALQARRDYQNKYRRENADKVKRWNKNYWERKSRKAKEEVKENGE